MATKSLVQSQFAASAEGYATSRIHAEGPSLARLIALTRPQPQWRMLDIATGPGHTAMAFAPHVAEVTATDLTPQMLKVAGGLAKKRGLANITFMEAAAESLPFPDGAFDLVTCRIAPHHFADVKRFVAEAKRVLRPRGVFGLVDNISPDAPAAAEKHNAIEKLRDPSHGRCLPVGEWLQIVRSAGLVVRHSEVLPKEIEFDSWAERMQAAEEVRPAIKALLRDPSPDLQAFLHTQERDGTMTFTIAEILLVATRV